MNTQTARSIELHALAICAWALVEQTDDTAKQASRVETARNCSLYAGNGTLVAQLPLGWYDDMAAASLDAEVEHAIALHNAAIAALVG